MASLNQDGAWCGLGYSISVAEEPVAPSKKDIWEGEGKNVNAIVSMVYPPLPPPKKKK